MENDKAKWKKYFSNGKEIIFSTASKKGEPNAIIVISLGIIDGYLLIANCQMKKTINNLKENNSVCIIGGYYKLVGKAKIISKGKYFDMAVKKSKGYKVKNAILIKPRKIINLDKIEIFNFTL